MKFRTRIVTAITALAVTSAALVGCSPSAPEPDVERTLTLAVSSDSLWGFVRADLGTQVHQSAAYWKPLYDKIHYLHHYNINPGPWAGLAMHPIEHVLYFSVTLIHWVIPSHPLHFLFNAQHTALTPAAGHTGFEGELTEQVSFGSYFHYLHHRHFDCNYGESSIPLDKWFGSFNDGSRTDSERSEARRTR